MSSKKEQAALVAFFNSFNLSKRLTAFDQLGDGKVLLEAMSKIDAGHFKSTPARSGPSSSSNDNWVLKMNTLKRLYRLLLSFPLPSPHPSSLSLSTLPEPNFSAMARSPLPKDGIEGLLQISRLCLSLSVWAPGNEKVIAKISDLGEAHMAQLMRSIEDVMATLPKRIEEDDASNSSPEKASRNVSPPPTGLRAERDKLLQDNDELRQRCETLIAQVSEMTSNLDEATAERDEAAARFQRETKATGLGAGQTPDEVSTLRDALVKAEEHLASTESKLEQKIATIGDLTKQVEDFRRKAAEATKLKDQLDEYRHAAEKLQKSENVIEKYKKKLEDSAGLRREIKKLEAENAQLIETNTSLESDLKRAGSSKTVMDTYRNQVEQLETQAREQGNEITQLQVQLEVAHADLEAKGKEHEQDLEELHLHQAKAKELELSQGPNLASAASDEDDIDAVGNTSLGEELGASMDGTAVETKTSLKLRIRALQRELETARIASKEDHQTSALSTLLADANKARDRYQADYLEAHRNALRLQANLEQIRSGKSGDNSLTLAALKQRIDEVSDEKDALIRDKIANEVKVEQLDEELRAARVDLSLVGKDQKEQLEAIRQSVLQTTGTADSKMNRLKEEIDALKEKDRLHLEEIKRLLMEKVGLQSTGISQREKALEREREFSDIQATLAKSGVDPETQSRLLGLHSQNEDLSAEVKSLEDKLVKAKDFIRNQDALFRADHAKSKLPTSPSPGKDVDTQIAQLKEDLLKARQGTAALEQRYKMEQQLMLSAWHELGSRTVRDHIAQAGVRRPIRRPEPTSWLGRQRKHQEEATYIR